MRTGQWGAWQLTLAQPAVCCNASALKWAQLVQLSSRGGFNFLLHIPGS